MKKIAIFGAGGFGREVLMLIEQINERDPRWEIIGFFDDGVKKGSTVLNVPVLGDVGDLNNWREEIYVVFAIGSTRHKETLDETLTNPNIKYPTLIHPDTKMGDKENLTIGPGTIITGGNILTVNISIGRHVLLNLACTVGHDAVIEDYCSIMPSVNVSGEVLVEKGVFLGTGTKIVNQRSIGQYTTVGAGSVVAKDLPVYCTAVGAPAKPIKFHQ